MQLTVCPHLGLLDDPTLAHGGDACSSLFCDRTARAPDWITRRRIVCGGMSHLSAFPGAGLWPHPQPRRPPPSAGARWAGWLWFAAAALLLAAFVAVAITAGLDWLRPPVPANSGASHPHHDARRRPMRRPSRPRPRKRQRRRWPLLSHAHA